MGRFGRALVTGCVVLGVLAGPTPPADAEWAIVAGSCLLDLEVTGSGAQIDIGTPDPVPCVMSDAVATEVVGEATLTGSAFNMPGHPFDCHGGVGAGWANFRVVIDGYPYSFAGADLKLANVEGAVKLAVILQDGNANFAGTGDMAQTPTAAEDCEATEDIDPVTWSGLFTWEDPVLE